MSSSKPTSTQPPPTQQTHLLALGAALITVSLWASAFIGIRAVKGDISAGPLSLCRLTIGSVTLGLVVALRRDALPPRKDYSRLILCGLLWFGAYNVMLNAGEQRIDAGTAAMLVNVAPVLIAILAGWLLHEGFPRQLVFGCVVALAGALIIGFATSQHATNGGWGVALCLAAAVAYAGGVIAQKPLLARTSALQITFLACLVGAIACLPFAPTLLQELKGAELSTIIWVSYLGLFPTALGFTTWAYALKRTTAGKMGATTYLVPPLTIIMSWLFLQETPPLLALFGGVFCLVGVVLSRWQKQTRQ